MSVRERNRYITTAVVFLIAFLIIGMLLVRSIGVMAQTFTFRPAGGTSNTYANGVASTQALTLAFDLNLTTAAVTYTNADFSGDGTPPDTVFTFSGRWSAFQQTVFFLRNVGLYVLRDGEGNAADQWKIEYSINGIGGTWITLDSDALSGPNPTPKSLVSTLTIPQDLDLESQLAVRTTTKQQGTTDAKLNIYDIRVEAEWNPVTGGPEPLRIITSSLPDGNKYLPYDASVQAVGGNKGITGYVWQIISGSLPPEFVGTNTGSPDYDYRITYPGGPPYTVSGLHEFTIKVSDTSTPTQTYQRPLSIYIRGLSIIPQGPDLPSVKKGQAYLPPNGQRFDYAGGVGPYYWCWSGRLPPGMSLLRDGVGTNPVPSCPGGGDPLAQAGYQATYVTLSGTPVNDGTFPFTLKLKDSSGEDTAVHDYLLKVGAYGVTLRPKALKDYIKGINYAIPAVPSTDLVAESIIAAGIDNSGAAGDIYVLPYSPPGPASIYPISGLNTLTISPGGLGSLPFSALGTLKIYIIGTIPVTQPGGDYFFELGIVDPGNPFDPVDSEGYQLRVLERKTLLLNAPPSTVQLPASGQLRFTVFAEGGAPSNSGDTALDNTSVPYYNYIWLVIPVGDSPPLDVASGIASGVATPPPFVITGPLQIPNQYDSTALTFKSGGVPVTGTYDVRFQAQDYLTRSNSTDPNYEFVPVEMRVKVIAPAGQTLEKSEGPTKLRQEQFR